VNVVVPSRWPADRLPGLESGRVHVWSVALDEPGAPLILSASERERAGRQAQERPARRWARARSELRRILAAYAGADPAELVIEPAPCVHCGERHGKPFLAGQERPLRFNVSHSQGLAVIAVAHGREVGVDVEATRGGRRLQRIAESRLSAAEAAELRGLEGPEHEAAFYRLWARREAYLKATAEGVFTKRGPDPPGSDPLGCKRGSGPPGSDPLGWEFADLDVGDGYAGALAVAPPGFRPGG
jgi:4'-phosphopantetheinyl transferase